MEAEHEPPRLLQRVERARRVVSLCSQATIRAYDEEALLSEACRTLLDVGDYSMAWLAETETASGPLRVLAHAGAETSGVRAVGPPWSTDSGRRSPTRRAILEQRPQVIRGVPTVGRTGASSLENLPEGCAAMCAFPIQFSPHGAGALTICAREADAFAPEEVALLRELAGDLAVGIAGLRAKGASDALEAKLEIAERRLRGLIEHAPIAIVQLTAAGDVLVANQATADLLGYASPSDIIGQPGHGFADHLDAADMQRLVQDARATLPVAGRELRLRRLDGSRVWVDLQARASDDVTPGAIEAFVRDLTPARAARLASSRLAAVVDSSEAAVIGVDQAGVVQSWSAGATGLYGFEANEAIGKPLVDLYVPTELRAQWTTMLASLSAGERIQRYDTRRTSKAAGPRDVSVAASPVIDADGQVLGASFIEHDVGERNRAVAASVAQERQQQEVAKLHELDRMRADFMNRASHELNTPLTPVLLQVRALRESPGLDAKQSVGLALIERNVVRLAVLVKDLLAATTLRTSQLALKPIQVDLDELVSHASGSFQAQAKKAGVTLATASAGPNWAFADPDRVLQVLFNLIGNSLKNTPAGGSVTLRTGERDGMPSVTVTDTGRGFEEESRAAMFGPFGRLHDDVPGAPGGPGLGLFISKGIVEGSGGEIWAESPGAGRGCTLGFTLPRRAPARSGNAIVSATGSANEQSGERSDVTTSETGSVTADAPTDETANAATPARMDDGTPDQVEATKPRTSDEATPDQADEASGETPSPADPAT